MRLRGLVLNRRMTRYMLGPMFRRPCDGCGRRWHFKGMSQSTSGPYGSTPVRHYCSGDCERNRT